MHVAHRARAGRQVAARHRHPRLPSQVRRHVPHLDAALLHTAREQQGRRGGVSAAEEHAGDGSPVCLLDQDVGPAAVDLLGVPDVHRAVRPARGDAGSRGGVAAAACTHTLDGTGWDGTGADGAAAIHMYVCMRDGEI